MVTNLVPVSDCMLKPAPKKIPVNPLVWVPTPYSGPDLGSWAECPPAQEITTIVPDPHSFPGFGITFQR